MRAYDHLETTLGSVMGSAPVDSLNGAEDRSNMQASLLVELDRRVGMSGPVEDLRGDLRGRTDDDLLRLRARGHNPALEGLVGRYQAPLYRFLYRMLNSAEDAERPPWTRSSGHGSMRLGSSFARRWQRGSTASR